ncbi:PREDICTED: CLAVATA3/ESR (CLE)-related protein 9-like [Camelina sativa]|uniref:CLAVATA3/ESR (CLE)-related protein 9-like n=1 Tax=Camelina sativa TaxID=90675 RepID=A0ABM0VS16_CAMSA|nr:PREDICTED: CLAVATA3/ESR (CLE)-related protein 9-like [Camelina sativa]
MTTTTHTSHPILILLLFVVSFLLKTSTATVANGNITSSSYRYQTHRFVPRIHHPYYVTPPHGSCDSFTRPYARSMCIELQRIHRSSRKQPILSPPPLEIDPRYGVDKRLVPSGPNPLHN